MANGQRVTPGINSKGLFRVQSPYVVDTKRIYEVTAIREFDDLWANGSDIFAEYYKPRGLTEQDYQRDVNLGAAIITLKSSQGSVYIPDTYIISYPEMGYQNYKHIVVSISLGAISDDQNLDALRTDLKELVSKHLGVEGVVNIHRAPTSSALTRNEVTQMEKVRRGLRDVPQSNSIKQQEATRKLNAIQQLNNSRLIKYEGIINGAKPNGNQNDVAPGYPLIEQYNQTMQKYNSPELDKYLKEGSWGDLNQNSLSNLMNSAGAFYDWFTSGKQTIKESPIVSTNRRSTQSTKEKTINSYAYDIIDRYKDI